MINRKVGDYGLCEYFTVLELMDMHVHGAVLRPFRFPDCFQGMHWGSLWDFSFFLCYSSLLERLFGYSLILEYQLFV